MLKTTKRLFFSKKPTLEIYNEAFNAIQNKQEDFVLNLIKSGYNFKDYKCIQSRSVQLNLNFYYSYPSDFLMWSACVHGCLKVVEALIDQSYFLKGYFGYKYLHLAFINDHFELMNFLIKNKINFKRENDNDRPTLFFENTFPNIKRMQILVDLGIDINQKNKEGLNALSYLLINKYYEPKDLIILISNFLYFNSEIQLPLIKGKVNTSTYLILEKNHSLNNLSLI